MNGLKPAHPHPDQLRAYGLGKLSRAESEAIDRHVSACDACTERLQNLPGDTLVALVRACDTAAEPRPPGTGEQGPPRKGATPPARAAPDPGKLGTTATFIPRSPAGAPGRPTPPPAETAPVPAPLLDHPRYRVVRPLGAGGMGTVYQAEHKVMKRSVALKVISPHLVDRPGLVERFQREVQTAARLSHPNIVTAHDAEQAGDTHFLVMEFVPGVNLAEVVKKKGPLPVAHACHYARQAALGLQHAFEQGMVHRDIKPANLMLTTKGRIKILDFGLARFASESGPAPPASPGGIPKSATLTQAGAVMGTPDYMAPEQGTDPHKADTRADLYSLGCTLYYLLTGRPPFARGTALERILAHAEQAPEPVTASRPDVPAGLARVLEQMLAKDPARRYQTPAEVAGALAPFIRPATTPAPAGDEPAASEAGAGEPSAETVGLVWASIMDDAPQGDVVVKPARSRRRLEPVVAAAAALLFVGLAIAVAVAVYRIRTDEGELVITTESDDVEVVIKQGGKLVRIVDTKTDKQVALALHSGVYELELKGAPEGLRLNIDRATLTRGKQTLAKIERVPRAAVRARPAPEKPGEVRRPPDPPPPEKVGEVRRFEGHTGDVTCVAISRDGRRGLSGSFDKTVRLWDLRTGKQLLPLEAHTDVVWCVALAPDGGLAASGGQDAAVLLWDLKTGKVRHRLAGHGKVVSAVAFSPGGRWLYSCSWDHTVRVWDVAEGKELRRFDLKVPVLSIAFAPDRRHALFGSTDGLLRLWDVRAGKEVRRFATFEGSVEGLAFAPEGFQAAASCFAEGTVRLYDAERGEEVGRFEGHSGRVDSVAFLPSGKRLLTAGRDGTLRLWDVASGRERHRVAALAPQRGLAVSPDGRYALSGSADSTVYLWRLPDPPPPEKVGEVRRFEGHEAQVNTVVYSPDGRLALTSSDDGTVRLWDVKTRKELRCLPGHAGSVYGLAFSPHGKRALSSGADKTVRLWDLEGGKELRILKGHTSFIRTIAFFPDGRRALSGGDDGTVRVWDVENGKELLQLKGNLAGNCANAALSPDGRRALSMSPDLSLRLWDLQTGEVLRRFGSHPQAVPQVVFSPDGRRALSACLDGIVRLWDVEKGEEIRRFRGHPGGVWSVAFSGDGRRALSAGRDTTVRLWDVEAGRQLHRFEGHTLQVTYVCFSPDSRHALSSGGGGTVRLWRLPDPPPPE